MIDWITVIIFVIIGIGICWLILSNYNLYRKHTTEHLEFSLRLLENHPNQSAAEVVRKDIKKELKRRIKHAK